MDSDLVKDDDVRPARRDGTCFYCRQPIGAKHNEDCVILRRTVVVEANLSIPVKINVPRCWSPQDIEFHLNGSSSCRNNYTEEIIAALGAMDSRSGSCLCDGPNWEYLEDYEGE